MSGPQESPEPEGVVGQALALQALMQCAALPAEHAGIAALDQEPPVEIENLLLSATP